MNSELLAVIIPNAIAIAIAITIAGILLYRALRTSDNPDLLELGDFIRDLVAGAEQGLAGESGTTKFDYVMRLVERQFPNLDTDLVKNLIEAAVYFLKQAQAETAAIVQQAQAPKAAIVQQAQAPKAAIVQQAQAPAPARAARRKVSK